MNDNNVHEIYTGVIDGTNLKVLDWRWFNGQSCVGIVLCRDVVTNHKKCYIGVATGSDERTDVETIAKWGTKFPLDAATIMMENNDGIS